MTYTPTEAHDALIELLETFADEGRSVLGGGRAREFTAAVRAAEVLSGAPPTASTCRELELWLALMSRPVFDSPRFQATPLDYQELVIECTQIVASALSYAAVHGMPLA